jgi:O-antigen ligase
MVGAGAGVAVPVWAADEAVAPGWPTPAVVRWLFVIFAATLPFEAMDLGFASSLLSIAKISGVLFIAAYFFYHNALTGKRRAPRVSAPLACFALYLGVYAASAFFVPSRDFAQAAVIFLTLVQLLLLFWIATDLLRQARLARLVLTAFAVASLFSAVASVVGLPGFSSAIESRIGERVTSLEFNPNYLALIMGVSALIIIDLALRMSKAWQGCVVVTAVLPLLAVLVRTGSRTGLAAFAIGLVLYVRFARNVRQHFAIAAVGAVLLLAVGVVTVRQHAVVVTRFQQSAEGDFAGRQKILPASIDMFLERPLTGWGPVALWAELSRRTGQLWGTKDAHNLYMHLLLEVGIFGAVPFYVGLYLCARAAWRARTGIFGSLPFALAVMLLAANFTHTYIARKPLWLFLAFLVAASSKAAPAINSRQRLAVRAQPRMSLRPQLTADR